MDPKRVNTPQVRLRMLKVEGRVHWPPEVEEGPTNLQARIVSCTDSSLKLKLALDSSL